MTFSFIPVWIVCDFDSTMDLRLLYSDFIMDNRELMLQSSVDAEPAFHDDRGFTYCVIPVFRSDDPDLAWDPLSTNRSLPGTPIWRCLGPWLWPVPRRTKSTSWFRTKCGCGVASRFTTRRWTQPGLSGKPELHVTSGRAPPRPLRQVATSHTGTGTSGLLVGSDPYPQEVAKRERRQLSVLPPGHPCKYGSSLESLSYRLPVLLALSGINLPDVVFVGAERKGPPRTNPQFHRGTGLLFLWLSSTIWPRMVRLPHVLRPTWSSRPGALDGFSPRQEVRTRTPQ